MQYLEIILSRCKDDKNLGGEYLIRTSGVRVFFLQLYFPLVDIGMCCTRVFDVERVTALKKQKQNCVRVCVVQHDSLFRPMLGCSLKFSLNLSPPSKFEHASMLRLYYARTNHSFVTFESNSSVEHSK